MMAVNSGTGSTRSTKSASIFLDPKAKGALAGDEEVTVSMYEVYSDDPSHPVHSESGNTVAAVNGSNVSPKKNRKTKQDSSRFEIKSKTTSSSSNSPTRSSAQLLNGDPRESMLGRGDQGAAFRGEYAGVAVQGGQVEQRNYDNYGQRAEIVKGNGALSSERTVSSATHSTHKTGADGNSLNNDRLNNGLENGLSQVVDFNPSGDHSVRDPGTRKEASVAREGSFTMKSAHASQVPDTSSSTSLHDENFKSSLEETLTRSTTKKIYRGIEQEPGQSPSKKDERTATNGLVFTVDKAEHASSSVTSRQPGGTSSQAALRDYKPVNGETPTGNRDNFAPGNMAISAESKSEKRTPTGSSSLGREESARSGKYEFSVTRKYSFSSSDATSANARPSAGETSRTDSFASSALTSTPSVAGDGSKDGLSSVASSMSTSSPRSHNGAGYSTVGAISHPPSSSASQEDPRRQQAGQFVMRHKEGADPTVSGRSANHDESQQTAADETASTKTHTVTQSSVVNGSEKIRSPLQLNDSFKANLSSLFGGGGGSNGAVKKTDTSASTPTSLATDQGQHQLQQQQLGGSNELNQKDSTNIKPASAETERLKFSYEAAPKHIVSNTFPRGRHAPDSLEVVSSMPTSPYNEIQDTVGQGTVGKLVKDIFWNLPLTGRSIDSASLDRPKLNKKQDEEKKFKFLVEGIDVGLDNSEQEEETVVVAATLAQTSLSSSVREGDRRLQNPAGGWSELEVHESDETNTSSLQRAEKRGFSYILDRKLAAEIKQKAVDVGAKRPHEKVEVKSMDRSLSLEEERKTSELLLDARAKLQKREHVATHKEFRSTEEKSAVLQEIRNRLQSRDDDGDSALLSGGDVRRETSVNVVYSSQVSPSQSQAKTPALDAGRGVGEHARSEAVGDRPPSGVTTGSVNATHTSNNSTAASEANQGSTSRALHASLSSTAGQPEFSPIRVQTQDLTRPGVVQSHLGEEKEGLPYVREGGTQEAGVNRQSSGVKDGLSNDQDFSLQYSPPTPQSRLVSPQSEPPDSAYFSENATTPSPGTTTSQDIIMKATDYGSHAAPVAVNYSLADRTNTAPSGGRGQQMQAKRTVVSETKTQQRFMTSSSHGRDVRETTSNQKTQRSTHIAGDKKDPLNGVIVDTSYSTSNEAKVVHNDRIEFQDKSSDSYTKSEKRPLTQEDIINVALSEPLASSRAQTIEASSEQTRQSIDTGGEDSRADGLTWDNSQQSLLQPAVTSTHQQLSPTGEQDSDSYVHLTLPPSNQGGRDHHHPRPDHHRHPQQQQQLGHRVHEEEAAEEPLRAHVTHGAHAGIQMNTAAAPTQRNTTARAAAKGELKIHVENNADDPAVTRHVHRASEDKRHHQHSAGLLQSSDQSLEARARYAATDNNYATTRTATSIGESTLRHVGIDVGDGGLTVTAPGYSNSSYQQQQQGQQHVGNLDSPGNSSTQSGSQQTYSSVSVPVASPSVSRTSSLSTTAQDTFEYSRSRPVKGQRDRVIPLQPIAVDVSFGDHVEMNTHPTTSASSSMIRRQPSDPGPAHRQVKHAPAMFEMSRLTDPSSRATVAATGPPPSSSRGHDQHKSKSSTVRTTYENKHLYRSSSDRMRDRVDSYGQDTTEAPVFSPPGTFLRVDESASGRIPRYNNQHMSVRDLESHEYGDRARRAGHVSRVNVDRDVNDLDTASALSEPAYGHSPGVSRGKYSVHRVMEKRGMTSQGNDLHPDMANYQRKRRGYHVSTGESDNLLSPTRTPSKVSTIKSTSEVTKVDPELEEAGKTGNRYNITVKLNASGSRPGSKQSHLHDEYRDDMSSYEQRATTTNRAQRSYASTGYNDNSKYEINNNVYKSPPPQRRHHHHTQQNQQQQQQQHQMHTSRYDNEVDERHYTWDSMPGPGEHTVYNYHESRDGRSNGRHVGNIQSAYNGSDRYPSLSSPTSPGGGPLRQLTLVHLPDQEAGLLQQQQQQLQAKASFKVQALAPEQPVLSISANKRLSRDDQYMIKSVTPSEKRQTRKRNKSDPGLLDAWQPNVQVFDGQMESSTSTTTNNTMTTNQHSSQMDSPRFRSTAKVNAPNHFEAPEPRFAMNIHQTMTMDYEPPDQEGEEPVNDDPVKQPLSRSAPPRRRPVDEPDSPEPSNVVRRPRPRKTPRKMQDDDDMESYLSPAEEDDDRLHDSEDMPQVVRGSILIKNTINTTGGPKVVDVVEGDDSDSEVVVEDNTNPFHNRFLQSRENPMYSSNEDLAHEPAGHSRRPNFTNVFDSKQKTSRDIYDGADEFDTEIQVTKGVQSKPRKGRSQPMNGHVEEGFDETWTETRKTNVYGQAPRRRRRADVTKTTTTTTESSEFGIARLLKDAPPDSIKQTINVEREEEEIMGPLNADGTDGLLNFDTVSEKVDMGMEDGCAQVSVKVRCERIVPIRGVDDMFKKSSVIVTRLISIDLLVTEERQKLYQRIMHGANAPMIDGGKSRVLAGGGRKLTTKETFNLYKTFMGLAEADEAGKQNQKTKIDRRVEDQRRPDLSMAQSRVEAGMPLSDAQIGFGEPREYETDDLDQKLERNIDNNLEMQSVDEDTMSYTSAAETADVMF